jgi:polysaccharide export outer membrane protein
VKKGTRWFINRLLIVALCGVLGLAGCSTSRQMVAEDTGEAAVQAPDYVIGPGDNVQIFVWRNAELSSTVPVRPDGRITTPLIEDVVAAGRTPTELARVMEEELSTYVKNPVVTVIVTGFHGLYDDQIRVVGQAANPQAFPYREGMSVLDVMIASGGLTPYAAGNRTVIVRRSGSEVKEMRVRLDDLLNGGDISANVRMMPGDTLIIPEAWF